MSAVTSPAIFFNQASALSFLLENLGKPVIVTGAQIPLSEVRNDAVDNLLGAIAIAGNYVIPEVTYASPIAIRNSPLCSS